MKLRRTLAVILSLLMLVFMAVPAVSGADTVPECGMPYLALESMLVETLENAYNTIDSGVGYTPESLSRLHEVIYKTEEFLAGEDGTEAEVQALIDELELAVAGLETPVASGDEIPFTLVQECRIQYYYPNLKSVLHLVKSVEQMDAVLDTIHGSSDDKLEPKPVRDPKYNDEYFAENALIIGLYVFSSGSIRQSIEMLAVDGDTLTVHRNILLPDGGTDDMMLRYALMEVKNSDIEGVVRVEDSYAVASFDRTVKVYGLWGDVNNDDALNIKDATAVQKHAAMIHMLYSANLYLADADGSDAVNIKDATEIQKYTAGIQLESSVGEITKVCLPVIYDETEVALTELYHTINDAKRQMAPGSNFVGSTVTKLMEEIDEAEKLYESINPKYSDVVAQTQALRDAIDGLEYVNLDTSELVPLMNEAQRLIDSGLYTEESTDVLIEANFNAQMVCLYGQTQSDVTQAIADLNSAIDALVLFSDEGAVQVPFEIAQMCRIEGFGAYDKSIYLVNSVAEMEGVLATIEEGYYEKPVRSEKYTDEYFEENSLIISMSLVGGSCCQQTIDKLTFNEDTLTLYRTVYNMELPTPDMNYQYVLIEVNNEDIAGAVNIREKAEVVTVVEDTTANDEDLTLPTETTPEDETITVYFTNTQNWEGVNIHFWGGTESTSWPGVKMEFAEHNIYGQDVYMYEIPSNTTGIVFNDAIPTVQTVDVLEDIKDCGGFYPTETENGKWLVESYDYLIPDPEVTTVYEPVPPVEETDNTEATVSEGTEIAFVEAQQCRVQGWGEMYDDEHEELYVVRNVAEFDEVLERIEGNPTYQWEPKPTRGEKYNDEYFMSDALVVCLYPLGSGSYTHTTDKLTIDGNNLTIHKTIYMPEVSTCDMNYQYILIEVNAFDVAQVTDISIEVTHQWVNVDE